MNPEVRLWFDRAQKFQDIAHGILGTHEAGSVSRVIKLEQVYDKLGALNVRQDDLMRQALRCTENSLYRAAHVMAWAACMDYIMYKLSVDKLVKLRSVRPKWPGRDIEEMAEYVPERQLVEALKDVGLATKNDVNALVSLLQKRNECAHPSDFLPELNETLGYIEEIIQRIRLLVPRSLLGSDRPLTTPEAE